MSTEYMVIHEKSFERWCSDPRANLDNFLNGYLYRFGREETHIIEKLQEEIKYLKEELYKERKCVDQYADERRWNDYVFMVPIQVSEDDWYWYVDDGSTARQRQKERRRDRNGNENN